MKHFFNIGYYFIFLIILQKAHTTNFARYNMKK